MIFLGIVALLTLTDGVHRIDEHPVPNSAYVLLGIGVLCLLGVIADLVRGGSLDD